MRSVDRRSGAASFLTLAAGVAIAEGIPESTGVRVGSSGPTTFRGRAASSPASWRSAAQPAGPGPLGYGINVHRRVPLRICGDRVTSLEPSRTADRSTAVLVETLAALARQYGDLLEGRFDAILDAWRARAPARSARASRGQRPRRIAVGHRRRSTTTARCWSTRDRVERIVAGEVPWRNDPCF